jgi:hypothetical protein
VLRELAVNMQGREFAVICKRVVEGTGVRISSNFALRIDKTGIIVV